MNINRLRQLSGLTESIEAQETLDLQELQQLITGDTQVVFDIVDGTMKTGNNNISFKSRVGPYTDDNVLVISKNGKKIKHKLNNEDHFIETVAEFKAFLLNGE